MPELNESNLLAEWKLDASVPVGFNTAVWRRIEQRSATPSQSLLSWLNSLFTRPAVAMSYATIALVLGLLAGQIHSSIHLRQQQSELQARYVRSVDPYAVGPVQ